MRNVDQALVQGLRGIVGGAGRGEAYPRQHATPSRDGVRLLLDLDVLGGQVGDLVAELVGAQRDVARKGPVVVGQIDDDAENALANEGMTGHLFEALEGRGAGEVDNDISEEVRACVAETPAGQTRVGYVPGPAGEQRVVVGIFIRPAGEERVAVNIFVGPDAAGSPATQQRKDLAEKPVRQTPYEGARRVNSMVVNFASIRLGIFNDDGNWSRNTRPW